MQGAGSTGHAELRRELGTGGAVLLGLGSILGTGAFVALGLAAGLVGGWMPAVVLVAGLVALGNALSSAQLAAAHPRSGGTYEYATLLLHPAAGFAAGFAFLVAKGASAAAAALGLAGYLGQALGLGQEARRSLAAGLVVVLTVLVAGGLRRSQRLNLALVATTLASLLAVGIAAAIGPGIGTGIATGAEVPRWAPPGSGALLEAVALVFVAYTGYGRVATLGEEVRDPARTLPRAILGTLALSCAVYLTVAWAATHVLGAEGYGREAAAGGAPLAAVARALDRPALVALVTAGAATALAGVLLNLLLGLSRVLLAMARRGDAPASLARVDDAGPRRAVLASGAGVLALVLLFDVPAAWSLSATAVLLYYGLTNAAALRLSATRRLYPRSFAWWGLASCSLLAFQVPAHTWLPNALALTLALLLRAVARRSARVQSARERGQPGH